MELCACSRANKSLRTQTKTRLHFSNRINKRLVNFLRRKLFCFTYFDKVVPPFNFAYGILNEAFERSVCEEGEAVAGVIQIDESPRGQIAEHAHNQKEQDTQNVLVFYVNHVRLSRLKLNQYSITNRSTFLFLFV